MREMLPEAHAQDGQDEETQDFEEGHLQKKDKYLNL